MFRSLFIGFLILSALTSKDVGVQTYQNIANISSDMLLELFNAAVAYADKQADQTVTKPDVVLFSNASGTIAVIEKLLRPIRHDNTVVWAGPDHKDCSPFAQYSKADLQQKQHCTDDVYSCGSDISPPPCRGN